MSVENFMVTLVLACIGSSGLASIVVALLNRKWSKDDKDDERIEALVAAQKVIIIDRVRYLAKQYIANDCIAIEDKNSLTGMYKVFKTLGGGDELDTLMSEVEKVHVSINDCNERNGVNED